MCVFLLVFLSGVSLRSVTVLSYLKLTIFFSPAFWKNFINEFPVLELSTTEENRHVLQNLQKGLINITVINVIVHYRQLDVIFFSNIIINARAQSLFFQE